MAKVGIEDWQELKKSKAILHNVSKNVSFDLNEKKDWRIFIGEEQELVEAKKYSYQNSEYASQGMAAAAEKGNYPGFLPLGYLAQYAPGRKRKIVIDTQCGALVKKLFELYATGDYNLRSITRKMYDIGLRSKEGYYVQLPSIFRMLRSPFYYGYFLWVGKLYKGNYEPLISKGLFEQVRDVLTGKTNHSGKHGRDFKYKGLLTCGLCGKKVVGEFKKNKYTYYHCELGKDKCLRPAYTEKQIDDLFALHVENLNWTEQAYDKLREKLEVDFHSQEENSKEEIASLQKQLTEVKAKIDRGLDLLLEGKVNPNLLQAKTNELTIQKSDLESRIAELEQVKSQKIDDLLNSLVLFKSFKKNYLQAPAENQKKLNKLLFITVKVFPKEGKKIDGHWHMLLEFVLNEPFATIFDELGLFLRQEKLEQEYLAQEDSKKERAWRDSNSRPAA